MIDINATLFIQMANVLFLLFLMNLILYKPIRRIVAERRQLIAGRQEGIEKVDAEVAAAARELEARIQEARKTGRGKIQELKSAAYEKEKDLLQEAMEQAARQLNETRAAVQRDIGAARDQLKAQIQSFSMDLAQKILGRSI